ncbi:hypothetical protein E8E12_000049, partial [Didymella heteroderae]
MDSQTSSAASSPTLSPTSPTSRALGAFPFPPIPDHIIVTFDGKVREMVRIEKEPVEKRQALSKPRRYYSKEYTRTSTFP